MAESVYIHIPYCKSKCRYCSFVSTTLPYDSKSYLNALKKEIKNYYKSETLNTLYFGGGTPSLLPAEFYNELLDCFKITDKNEITFEINPDDANINYLKLLKNIGINRLSFGVQTFDDNILKLIGRRHYSEDIFKAVSNAKESGFDNISVDLIYGLPKQTLNTLKYDLKIVKDLDISHISTYGLKIEKTSYFYFNPPENLPDDDTQADMYLFLNEFLGKENFIRYEISNFSKPGFESRHNINYWNNKEYYGFGVAAHGYINNLRYSNNTDIDEYIKNPVKHQTEHFVTQKEKLEEEIFLGFRKECGINKKEINQKFNIDFDNKYKDILKKYIPDYIIPTKNGYKLSINGILLSNNILAEFIDI